MIPQKTEAADMDYTIVITPLSEKDGGGFAGYVPDLPGCMSDGESQEETLANTRLAIEEWIETARKLGRKIPAPGSVKPSLQGPKTLIEALSISAGPIPARRGRKAAVAG
jgi:antitoxin HicB